MELKIEKGIPMPDKRHYRKNPIMDAIKKMEIGDSVLMERKSVNGMGYRAVKLGYQFSTRKEGEGAVRVWRTK